MGTTDAAAMPRRQVPPRLGGGMVLVGTVAWIILSGLHGDLSGDDLSGSSLPVDRPRRSAGRR